MTRGSFGREADKNSLTRKFGEDIKIAHILIEKAPDLNDDWSLSLFSKAEKTFLPLEPVFTI